MREIKFRAWDKDNKRMFTVFHWHKGDEFDSITRLKGFNGDETFLVGEEVELMQYTGLKDKNGKEIYEGDILKNHNDTTLLGKVVFGYYGVSGDDWGMEFKTPCFCQEWCDESGHSCIDEDIEVIGNIYENKELLK